MDHPSGWKTSRRQALWNCPDEIWRWLLGMEGTLFRRCRLQHRICAVVASRSFCRKVAGGSRSGDDVFMPIQRLIRTVRRGMAAATMTCRKKKLAGEDVVEFGTDAVAGSPTAGGGEGGIPPRLSLEFGHALLPHPEKIRKGGEDAYFCNTFLNAFGVADGVGAWSTMGVDPAKFSRALMRYSEQAIADNDETLTPIQALRVAYDAVRQESIQGSCTAVVGVLRGSCLHIANLGDSGVLVLTRKAHGTAVDHINEDVELLHPRQNGTSPVAVEHLPRRSTV